jgi:hypothetical protein
MAMDDDARYELHRRLEEVLGRPAATTLMEHLPPVGWGDVARRSDIDTLQAATKRDIDVLIATFDAKLHRALNEQTRTLVVTMVYANLGAIFTAAGLAFAAARFH